jgi:glycosyltransferase involved in cell wall biosynthesis
MTTPSTATTTDPHPEPRPPRPTLTIFFPMWNEEDFVGRVVDAAREVCDHLVAVGELSDYELLLVDDASTDGTGKLADEQAALDPRVRVVHHEVNRKLGGALKTGFAEATGDLVLYTDADLPFDLLDLEKALRLLRIYEADVVSAYRHDRTAEGPRRAIYSFVYNNLIRWGLGLRVRDINFSFKLVRREVLDHVTLISEGSFIDAELLGKAHRLGFQIIQFGVDYFPRTRGVSTLSSFGVIATMLREMRRLVPEVRRTELLSRRRGLEAGVT